MYIPSFFILPLHKKILPLDKQILFFITGILFVLMMSHLQKISSTARGTGAALANSSMYIGQTIGAAVGGMLFASFHNFISIGYFTAALYVFSLLVFRKSDRYIKKEVGEKQRAVS
ncbi:hypothetical protein BTH41_03689 [Bacillus mycoides]|nr:hypothetical protein BTH41_03689 [Bacillus mycoides]